MLTKSSVQPLPSIINSIYDKQFGILNSIEEIPPDCNSPKFFHYYSESCNTKAFSLYENFRSNGGAAIERNDSIAKAIGEGVERYCAALFSYDDFKLSSYNKAQFNCTHPTKYALYSKGQYEKPGANFVYRPFDKDTQINWIDAYDLRSDEKVFVPAAMVYCPYYYLTENGDTPIVQPISTGLACHNNIIRASISGICEVIERDVFTLMWQLMLPSPKIIKSSIDRENKNIIERFEKTGANVQLFYLTLDQKVPAVLSVYEGHHMNSPSLAFAASAALTKEEATKKSLEELAHTLRYSQQIKNYMPVLEYDYPDHNNILDQADHLNFWSNYQNKKYADWLLEQDESLDYNQIENIPCDSSDESSQLATLIELIEDTGHKVLVKNITTSDVDELGLTVIRAIIPGYHPLFMGHAIRSIDSKRYKLVAKKYNKIKSKNIISNPNPHPYP